jgi:hypothetical protein
MKAKAAREYKWLKSQQKLRGSDVAEFFVSVTDIANSKTQESTKSPSTPSDTGKQPWSTTKPKIFCM